MNIIKKDNNGSIEKSIFAGIGLLFFGVAFLFFCLTYGILAGGFVGMKLWSWFIVPTFGLNPLTWAQAWGVSALVGYWTHQHITIPVKDERPTHDKIGEYIGLFCYPWFVLILAYIGKCWFM